MNEQVKHREYLLNLLILEFELFIESLLIFLKLLNNFFDKGIIFLFSVILISNVLFLMYWALSFL